MSWRLAVRNFYYGIADSIRGCYKIFVLDRPITSAQSSSDLSTSSPSIAQPARTTLALRRLETRSKQRETSSQRTDDKPKALYRLGQCIILNLICILLFHYLLLPLIELTVNKLYAVFVSYIGSGESSNNNISSLNYEWISTFLTNMFNALWVLPVFIITRIVNALWFQDIANAALRRRSKSGVALSFR